MSRDIAAGIAAAHGKKGEVSGRGLIRTIICLSPAASGRRLRTALYSVNMRYEPTKVIRPALTDGRKYTLTVASFIDKRKMEDTLLIGRVIKSDGAAIPITA